MYKQQYPHLISPTNNNKLSYHMQSQLKLPLNTNKKSKGCKYQISPRNKIETNQQHVLIKNNNVPGFLKSINKQLVSSTEFPSPVIKRENYDDQILTDRRIQRLPRQSYQDPSFYGQYSAKTQRNQDYNKLSKYNTENNSTHKFSIKNICQLNTVSSFQIQTPKQTIQSTNSKQHRNYNQQKSNYEQLHPPTHKIITKPNNYHQIEQKKEIKYKMPKIPTYVKNKKKNINDFQLIKELGNGRYGNVMLVRDKASNMLFAIKKIEKKVLKEEEIVQQFIREVKIQMYLNHPNIMRLYGLFHDQLYIYTIQQVGIDKQLHHLLKKKKQLSQTKVASIMRQICKAVEALHQQKIIHRDIKPQNIVFHENVVKLCDFGWSVYQNNKLRTTFCGTPLYVCPQILKGVQYDEKVDIWALGIIMYEMLVGQSPFKITKQEQLQKIIIDEIQIPQHITLSKQATNFLYLTLDKNPNRRVGIKQLNQHKFFKLYPEKNSQKNKILNI